MTQYSYTGGKAQGLPLVAGVETLRRSDPALTSFPLPQVGVPEGELPSVLPFSYSFARGFDWSVQPAEGALPTHEDKWWDIQGTTSGLVTQALGAPSEDTIWQTRDSLNGNWFAHRPAGDPLGRYFQYSTPHRSTGYDDVDGWALDLVGARHEMADFNVFTSESRFPGRVVQIVSPTIDVDAFTGDITYERYHSVSSNSWLTGYPAEKNRVCQATVQVTAGAILIGTYYISEAVDPSKTLPAEFGIVGHGVDAPQPVVGWILRPGSPPEPYIGTLRTPLWMPKLVSTSVGNGWTTYVWSPADFALTNRGYDPVSSTNQAASYPTVYTLRRGTTPSFTDMSATVPVDFDRNDVFQRGDTVSLTPAPEAAPDKTYMITSITPDSPVVGQMRVGLRQLTGALGNNSDTGTSRMWRISPKSEWVEGGLYCNPVAVYVPTFSKARFLAGGGWLPSGLPWLISYHPKSGLFSPFPAVASTFQYSPGFNNWGWSYGSFKDKGKLVRAVSFVPATDYTATGAGMTASVLNLFGLGLTAETQRSVVSGAEVLKVRLTVAMRTSAGAALDPFSTGYDYDYGQILRVAVVVDPVTREYWYYCNGVLLDSGTSSASGTSWQNGIMQATSASPNDRIVPATSSSAIVRQCLAIQGTDVDLDYARGLTFRDFTVPADLGGTLPA